MAALFLVGSAACLPMQSASGQGVTGARADNGVILGVVTDSSLRPIADVDVSILLSRVHVAADARGRFRIVDVPSGSYLLVVRRLGFQSITAGVTVQAGDTVRLALQLEASVATLAGVTVTATGASARRREFEDRRRTGAGEFFDQRQIEARNAVAIVDILRQVKGLRVSMEGSMLIAMSARQWTPCPMQVYVDGIPLAGYGNQPFDLNQLPSPKEIMALEIYSGPEQEPLWLPTGPSTGKRSCGAILVWTRDGSMP
jgi:hypothetical protein